MATVTGLTAARMLEIEGASITDAEVIDDELILTKHDGTTLNAGNVTGPAGPTGPPGTAGGMIPGEVRLWPGDTLPLLVDYGLWDWADGGVLLIADHPLTSAHISDEWRTFAGASDPGPTNFRKPDMRGLVPAGMDQMPGAVTRANRITRAVAIILAGKTGEETHVITLAESAAHNHGVTDPGHSHQVAVVGGGGAASTSVGGNDQPAITSWLNGKISSNGTGISINNNGGGGAHENVQPTVFMPYIVKLDD